MARKLKIAAAISCLALGGCVANAYAQDTIMSCGREARAVTIRNAPINIYASSGEWAQVLFPQKVTGYLPEVPKGIDIHAISYRNRLYFQVENNFYAGLVYVTGKDGTTYALRVLARKNCADSVVTLKEPINSDSDESASSNGADDNFERQGGMTLIDYLYLGKVPDGFTKEEVKGSPNQREVFKQGSVYGYIEQMWQGQSRTGFVIRLVNYGRTPVKVNISGIDYDSPNMQKIFGRVTSVSMQPRNMILGPEPEYASQQTHPENAGLLFIAARKDDQ